MIAVLDTNVWISGILWTGPPHDVVMLAERGKISVASSEPLLDELFEVLAREKFRKHLTAAGTNLDAASGYVSALVRLYSVHQTVSVITADPSDNEVLACALAAHANTIVSGDDHLLALNHFQDIPVITPRQFLERFK
jgi:putative PIN family toxin of toxin-antitoxin system